MAAMSAYQKVRRTIGKSNPMTTQSIDDAIMILRMFNQKMLCQSFISCGLLDRLDHLHFSSRVKVGTLKAPKNVQEETQKTIPKMIEHDS